MALPAIPFFATIDICNHLNNPKYFYPKHPTVKNPSTPLTSFSTRLLQHYFIILLGVFMAISARTSAQGDLLLFPKRIVFEGAKKSQSLNLANSGKDTVRYLISVVQIRMKEDGSFETISQPDSGQRFADKYFRFFPRSVVLAPNESQTVKLQLTNTASLEPGEYRSHLYFRAEPVKKPLGEEEISKDSGSISVNLVAIFGISIPVIIRVGESSTTAGIVVESLQLKHDSIPALNVTLKRSGNMSVYGDLSVDYISIQGKVTRIGVAQGLAIYSPNTVRHFHIFLDNKKNVDYHSGKLRITYTTQPDAKSVKLAEGELVLGEDKNTTTLNH
jgi:hypothetical protein